MRIETSLLKILTFVTVSEHNYRSPCFYWGDWSLVAQYSVCKNGRELKARISGREETVHQCPTHNSGTVVTTYTLLFQISHDILSSVFVAEHLLSQSYL